MESVNRTRELINLGGLIRLSGLDAKIKDPATLLGLLSKLNLEVDDLNESALKKAKNQGVILMKNRSKKITENESKKRSDNSSKMIIMD